ncbi:MAG: substrate-binding domain-containing protein [Tepidisphaeraceae bacterium]
MSQRLLKFTLCVAVMAAVVVVAIASSFYVRSQSEIESLRSPVAMIDAERLIAAPSGTAAPAGPTVRCAVINGMNITGFWKAVTDRFTQQTGIRIETVSFGEKAIIDNSFREGGIDLLTMHACDKVINLVADGLAFDARPWARNDLVIVGPPSDPAGVRGLTDAAEAFRRIAKSGSQLVVHSSLGAQEVLRGILVAGNVQFDPARVTMLFDDPNREVLKTAADKTAYTLIGRIPFRMGRLPNAGLELLVQGDPAMRRPYVVVVANPETVKGARVDLARQLADYLSSPATQAWIETWGRGQLDDRPVFFPVKPKPNIPPVFKPAS